MRKLYAVVALALCSTGAPAADFGIGVSARSDDGWLYVPIDISKAFRLEPSIRYASTDLKFTQGTSVDTQDTDTWELGVGVFGLKQITDAAHIYYGARLAYVDAKTTTTDTSSFGLPLRSETNQDGYRIGPTVGFEYVFAQHFSVGGEASYTFLDIEGESRARIGNSTDAVLETEQKSQGTQTRLIFRYMF